METIQSGINEDDQTVDNNIDEIKTYLDCRYLLAYEAAWRLFAYGIHHREPAVQRLLVHLPNEQNVYFNDNENLSRVIQRPHIEKTLFTQWLNANEMHEEARNLLYVDFPTKWIWNNRRQEWQMRQQGRSVGRIIYIHLA